MNELFNAIGDIDTLPDAVRNSAAPPSAEQIKQAFEASASVPLEDGSAQIDSIIVNVTRLRSRESRRKSLHALVSLVTLRTVLPFWNACRNSPSV
jgi:hypothetical protein